MGRKKGQSIVEFTLIGLLVLVVSLGGISFFGGSIGDLFERNNSRSLFKGGSRTAINNGNHFGQGNIAGNNAGSGNPPTCPPGSTLIGSANTSWACVNTN